MSDAGMFDVIIGKLMKTVGDSVVGVAVVTAVIALVGHLDGGASTFCIVIPTMLPVYQRMHMRPTTLLLFVHASPPGHEGRTEKKRRKICAALVSLRQILYNKRERKQRRLFAPEREGITSCHRQNLRANPCKFQPVLN